MIRTYRYLLVLLLTCCASVGAAAAEGERRDLCKKPKCIWMNNVMRRGEFSLSGELSVMDEGKAFCHEGPELPSLEGLTKLWTVVRVSVNVTPADGLIIARGHSSDEALSGDETKTYWKEAGSHSLHLSPHAVDCLALIPETIDNVQYELRVSKTVAYWSLLLLCVGVALVFAAPHLSRNVPLFYGAGITLGVVASILILLYMFSKFVPKKTSIVGLGILTGGYTLFASFFYWFWNNALEVALSNWQYITAYMVAAALLSFAFLYRVAPPTNERTLDLIQWTVQLVGVASIYLSSQIQGVGVALVVATLLTYNFSRWLLPPFLFFYRLLAYLLSPLLCLLTPFSCVLTPLCRLLSFLNPRRWFTPVPRLLTQQEFEEEGRVETKKALEDLSKYCRRRDNEIWDKISNLHDSKRFTSFLAGKSHVSAQEQVDYEWQGGGLDSTSESEMETSYDNDDNLPSRTGSARNSPHRSSYTSSRSSLSRSPNSSSDSPTFMRTHHHPPQHSHHFASTPRTRTPYSRR